MNNTKQKPPYVVRRSVSPPFILRQPVNRTTVIIRHVRINTAHNAIWGKVLQFYRHKNTAENLLQAIRFARRHLEQTREGTIVYVVGKGYREPIAIYECKFGTDKQEYRAWKPVSLAVYWHQRLLEIAPVSIEKN